MGYDILEFTFSLLRLGHWGSFCGTEAVEAAGIIPPLGIAETGRAASERVGSHEGRRLRGRNHLGAEVMAPPRHALFVARATNPAIFILVSLVVRLKFVVVLTRGGDVHPPERKRHTGMKNPLRRCLQKLEGVPSPPPAKPAMLLHRFLLYAAIRGSLEWPRALPNAESDWHAQWNPLILSAFIENRRPVSTEKCKKVHEGKKAGSEPQMNADEHGFCGLGSGLASLCSGSPSNEQILAAEKGTTKNGRNRQCQSLITGVRRAQLEGWRVSVKLTLSNILEPPSPHRHLTVIPRLAGLSFRVAEAEPSGGHGCLAACRT
jgi:hypothetical protein